MWLTATVVAICKCRDILKYRTARYPNKPMVVDVVLKLPYNARLRQTVLMDQAVTRYFDRSIRAVYFWFVPEKPEAHDRLASIMKSTQSQPASDETAVAASNEHPLTAVSHQTLAGSFSRDPRAGRSSRCEDE